jgi:hypothetical protein
MGGRGPGTCNGCQRGARSARREAVMTKKYEIRKQETERLKLERDKLKRELK